MVVPSLLDSRSVLDSAPHRRRDRAVRAIAPVGLRQSWFSLHPLQLDGPSTLHLGDAAARRGVRLPARRSPPRARSSKDRSAPGSVVELPRGSSRRTDLSCCSHNRPLGRRLRSIRRGSERRGGCGSRRPPCTATTHLTPAGADLLLALLLRWLAVFDSLDHAASTSRLSRVSRQKAKSGQSKGRARGKWPNEAGTRAGGGRSFFDRDAPH
jgi:hypothetical protein